MNPSDTIAAGRSPGALGLWVRNLLCLLVPAFSVVHLWTGPHAWPTALGFLLAILSLELLERIPLRATAPPPPPEQLPGAPFIALLYVFAALQFTNIALLCDRLSQMSFAHLDTYVAIVWATAASSGAIVLAHELIHRPPRGDFLLGRLLLTTVLYEHFATEHVRGHHPRVGTEADPATARFGERFWPFFRRTVPGQFRSALALETTRLQLGGVAPLHPRWLRHRVVQGLAVQLAMLVAIAVYFGPVALFGFVLQAIIAVISLEAVNYFEHWGLARTGKTVESHHSWDCDSWFTQYSLVGLSRHADHHRYASKPFYRLELHAEAPMLPVSYGLMVNTVLFQNDKAMKQMTEELGRRGLLPADTDPAPAE